MTLVCLPFGFRTARAGGSARGIVVGLSLAFAYWIVLTVALSIGRSGTLSPLVAAWLPNLLFGGVGVYLAVSLDRI